ncbi:urea amidolyase associated protein UAAP1 [Paenibacillus filicis]|uniref:Urea amidolyase associated protein UAAP1 n=1 Tax=Paenibacillus filicis TaxID=669464 RepID=A0ABU9DJ36_9BACL
MTTAYSITLQPGHKWSAYVSSGKLLRFTADGDEANLSCLFYHARHTAERYNMPDTLKAQHTAFLSAGHILMSDQGRALVSITEDTVGWHDTLSGYTTREGTDAKYGGTSFQTHRNEWLRSGEENLTVELFRHGLAARDLSVPLNLFSKVVCELNGDMHYVQQPTAGRYVTLRTEMDVLAVFSSTPNPLNPSPAFPVAAIEVQITNAEPVSPDDKCVQHCSENRRAFDNTWNAHKLTKGAY